MNLRAASIIVLLFPLLLLWKVTFNGQSLSGGDLVNQYIPYKSLIIDEIRAGEFPHWNPLTFSGRPLQADVQTGVFYPPNWLFLFVPEHRAFSILTVLHYMFMGLGALFFFRSIFQSGFPSLIAASALCFSGFFVTQLHSGIVLFIFTGAWLPWMFWAAERGIVERKVSGFVWLGVFGALQLLAGAPQIAFYSWLLVGVYLLVAMTMEYRATRSNRDEKSRAPFGISPQGWLAALGLIAAAALAASLTAVQWMPTREFLALSFERGRGASWEYVTNGSFEWNWLPTFLAPFIFGHPADEGYYWGSSVGYWEFNGYIGVLPFVLALIGLSSLRRSVDRNERRLAIFALVCMVVWIALAPGKHSPVFRLAYQLLPGFKSFRVPARWVLAYQLGMACLAGLGCKRLMDEFGRKILSPLHLVAGAIFFFGFGAQHDFIDLADHFGWKGMPEAVINYRTNSMTLGLLLLPSLIFTSILVLLVVRNARFRRIGIALTLMLLSGDLLYFSNRLVQVYSAKTFMERFYPQTGLVKELRASLVPGQRWTWDDSLFDWTVDQNQEELYPNRPVMYGLPALRGYDPVNSLRYGQFSNAMAGIPVDESPRGFMQAQVYTARQLLALLNTGPILSYQPLQQAEYQMTRSFPLKRDAMAGSEPVTLGYFTGEKPVGSAFLARPELLTDEEAADAEFVLGTLLSPQFDWRNVALVDVEELPALKTGAVDPKTGTAWAKSIQRMRAGHNWRLYNITTPETSVLVLSESYYPGWRARVDGVEQETFPADHALVGTFVEPGRHEVEFYYLPKAFLIGRTITATAIIGLLILLWVMYRRSRVLLP